MFLSVAIGTILEPLFAFVDTSVLVWRIWFGSCKECGGSRSTHDTLKFIKDSRTNESLINVEETHKWDERFVVSALVMRVVFHIEKV